MRHRISRHDLDDGPSTEEDLTPSRKAAVNDEQERSEVTSPHVQRCPTPTEIQIDFFVLFAALREITLNSASPLESGMFRCHRSTRYR